MLFTSRFSGPAARRWDMPLHGLLPAAQGRIVRNGPVQPGQPQQPGDHSGGLSERQREQHLDRQAEQDRRIQEDRRAPGAALMRRVPGHLLVHPDQQRPARPERIIVGGPARCAVAGGLGLAHAARLTAWIHEVNPSRSVCCNNAGAPAPTIVLVLTALFTLAFLWRSIATRRAQGADRSGAP